MQAIAPNALDRWHEHLALAIRRLRQPDFLAALVDAIHQLVPIESSMISLERKGHAPTLLYERGIAERFREAIIRRYFSRGYLLDPFCLAVEEGLPEGFYTLGEIAPDDFFQSAYYQTYYLGAGAVEDVYYILDLGPTEKLSICLYNGLSASRYSDAQVAALAGLAPPVLEPGPAVLRRPRRPLAEPAGRPRPAPSGSTARLRSRRAHRPRTRGLPPAAQRPLAKSSARLMDISPETVRMHRKNLYTKLEVGSQSELFALFIECLSQGSASAPETQGETPPSNCSASAEPSRRRRSLPMRRVRPMRSKCSRIWMLRLRPIPRRSRNSAGRISPAGSRTCTAISAN